MVRKLLNLILIFVCLSWGVSRAWAAKDLNIKNNTKSFFYLNGTSGNVGIGSVNPGQLMDVQGTVRTMGFTMSGQTPISGYVLTASDSAGDTTWSSGGAVSGWTVSGNNVYESLNGNVGIGTTKITTAALTVMNGNVGIGTWVPGNSLDIIGGNIGIGTGYNLIGIGTTSTILTLRNDTSSIYLGWQAGASTTVGNLRNVAIGFEALQFNTTGLNNSAIGNGALSTNTTGSGNSVMGYFALSSNTTGSNNSAVGFDALNQNSTGSNNTAVGYSTLNNSAGSNNSGFGYEAGDNLFSGSNSLYLGYNAEPLATNDDNEIVIGANAVGIGSYTVELGNSQVITTQLQGNVGIGSLTPGQKVDVQGTVRALYFVGNGAGLTGLSASGWSQSGTSVYTTTASNNVGIGTSIPGNKLDVAGGNIGIGTAYNLIGIGTTSTILTLHNDTTSVYLGWQSGASTAGGSNNNTSLGSLALADNTTGYSNTAVGEQALNQNTTAYGNSAVGLGALFANTGGADNTAMGTDALYWNSTGNLNSALGDDAGMLIASGTKNQTSYISVYIGNQTEALANGDANEIVIGSNAVGIGSYSVELGNSTIATTQLQGNVGIGTWIPKNSLEVVGGNIGIGTAYNLVGIGTTSTILTLRTDTSSVYLGWQAGASATGAFLNNAAVGYQALTNITLGNDNAAVGYSALVSNTSGIGNSALGWDALFSNTTGIENAAVGQNSLVSNTTGNQNTAMGYAALNRITSGSVNSALGVQAGMFISGSITGNQTSSNSLYLGYNTEALADGDTNETVIGYSAVGLGSNTVELGNSSVLTTQLQGNVGIGTSVPTGKLIVLGGNVGIGTGTPSARMQVSGQYNSIRVNNGNQPGASMTIDWNNGNVQAVTLTGTITTLTLNNPVAGGRYLLEIKQGGAGSFAITWPASVNWPSGTAPTLTATTGQSDIITLYYNGTNYAGFYSLNYSI